MKFQKITMIACISLALAGCGDEDKKASASADKPAPAKAEVAQKVEPAKAQSDGGNRLTPASLQEDKSVYWSVGGGAEVPFIFFGKTQGAGSIVEMIPRMYGVRPDSGDETLELLRSHAATSDAFARKEIETKLAPLLEAKIKRFAEHDFYKMDIPGGFASLSPYDFNTESFPVEGTLFSSVEWQQRADANKSPYTNESHKYFLQYTDSKGFRLGFINGDQMRSIKVPQDQARAVESARSKHHSLELHIYGSPAMTMLSSTVIDKETRTLLMEGQYVEIVDHTDGGKVIYGGTF